MAKHILTKNKITGDQSSSSGGNSVTFAELNTPGAEKCHVKLKHLKVEQHRTTNETRPNIPPWFKPVLLVTNLHLQQTGNKPSPSSSAAVYTT